MFFFGEKESEGGAREDCLKKKAITSGLDRQIFGKQAFNIIVPTPFSITKLGH